MTPGAADDASLIGADLIDRSRSIKAHEIVDAPMAAVRRLRQSVQERVIAARLAACAGLFADVTISTLAVMVAASLHAGGKLFGDDFFHAKTSHAHYP